MGVADVGGAVFLVIQRPWQDGNAKKNALRFTASRVF